MSVEVLQGGMNLSGIVTTGSHARARHQTNGVGGKAVYLTLNERKKVSSLEGYRQHYRHPVTVRM